jgi:hypothetical protein
MRPHDDPVAMTADEQIREVAAILAVGLRRLRARCALPTDPLTLRPLPLGEGMVEGCPKNLPESSQDRLEAPGETVLTVHRG